MPGPDGPDGLMPELGRATPRGDPSAGRGAAPVNMGDHDLFMSEHGCRGGDVCPPVSTERAAGCTCGRVGRFRSGVALVGAALIKLIRGVR